MPSPIFIQRGFGGRAIFLVSSRNLEITTSSLRGRWVQHHLLHSLDPTPKRIAEYSPQLLVSMTVVSILFGQWIWQLLRAGPAFVLFAEALLPVLLVTTAIGLRALLPFVRYEFSYCNGAPAFNVHREPYQGRDCDNFVAELIVCIDAARGRLERESITDLVAGIASPPVPPAEWKWLGALVCGSIAAILPFVHGFDRTFDAMAGPVLLAFNAGSVILAVYSFLGKERRRWLALLGVAATWFSPLFF